MPRPEIRALAAACFDISPRATRRPPCSGTMIALGRRAAYGATPGRQRGVNLAGRIKLFLI